MAVKQLDGARNIGINQMPTFIPDYQIQIKSAIAQVNFFGSLFGDSLDFVDRQSATDDFAPQSNQLVNLVLDILEAIIVRLQVEATKLRSL